MQLSRLLLVVLLISFTGQAQTFCPGDSVLEEIASYTVPPHQSQNESVFGCWNGLTEFRNFPSMFPTGIDVGIVVTDFTGLPGSIVDHTTLNPIANGDTLYLRKESVNYYIQLRHNSISGFSFKIILFGMPTEFNEPYNCTFAMEGLYYPANCMQYGYGINGLGDCLTCSPSEEQKPEAKELIKITDITGREVRDKPNTLLVYIYNDGSMEKVIRVE